MTALRVYVAMPFGRRQEVLDLHSKLEAIGIQWTSQWALGTEKEAELTVSFARRLAQRNDEDIARSHALLVHAFPGEGGEMFAEARLAVSMGIPVVWVGRKILTAWRDGVFHVEGIDRALVVLGNWARVAEPFDDDMVGLTRTTIIYTGEDA